MKLNITTQQIRASKIDYTVTLVVNHETQCETVAVIHCPNGYVATNKLGHINEPYPEETFSIIHDLLESRMLPFQVRGLDLEEFPNSGTDA